MNDECYNEPTAIEMDLSFSVVILLGLTTFGALKGDKCQHNPGKKLFVHFQLLVFFG